MKNSDIDNFKNLWKNLCYRYAFQFGTDIDRINSHLFLDHFEFRWTISPYKNLPDRCFKINLYLT